MKQEIGINNCADFGDFRGYYNLIFTNVGGHSKIHNSKQLNDNTPTARFKIRSADKQENSIMWNCKPLGSIKGFYRAKDGEVIFSVKDELNYVPTSPTSPRIVIDELLCVGFKRTADVNATKTDYNEHR